MTDFILGLLTLVPSAVWRAGCEEKSGEMSQYGVKKIGHMSRLRRAR